MRLTIESTSEILTLDGVACRTWIARTDAGVPVHVHVHQVSPGTHDPAVLEQFAAALQEVVPPAEIHQAAALPVPDQIAGASLDVVHLAELRATGVVPATASTIGLDREGHTFDAVAAWRAMPGVVQDMIGALAIVERISDLGGCIAQETGDPEAWRWFEAAASESASRLSEVITAVLLGGDSETMPPRPDLRPLGIAQCRVCGCTDEIGCDVGCSWVEPDLCSAHTPAAIAQEG